MRYYGQQPLALLLSVALLLLLLQCARSGGSDASNQLLRDIKRFKRTLASGPNAATSYNLATALLSLGNTTAALPHLLHALSDPNFPGRHDALMNAGVCFERLGRSHDCARAYWASMRLKPGPVAALNLLTGSRSLDPSPQAACDAARAGFSFLRLSSQRPPSASPSIDAPSSALLHPILDFTADALCSCGRTSFCIAMLLQSVKSSPTSRALFLLGQAMRQRGDLLPAASFFRESAAVDSRLLSSDPAAASAQEVGGLSPLQRLGSSLSNLGTILQTLGFNTQASEAFERATETHPQLPQGWCNLGEAHRLNGKWKEALQAGLTCEQALQQVEASDAFKPNNPTSLHIAATNQVNLALYSLHLWMWDACGRYLQRAQHLTHNLRVAVGVDGAGQPPVFSGYHCVVFGNMSWGQRLDCLHTVAQHLKFQALRPFIADVPRYPLALLHIAYISSDFAAHTTGANILGLFRSHDAAVVHVMCVSLSPSDGSEVRSSFERYCHLFEDVVGLADAVIAQRINSAGVRLLVDLNGYTHGARSGVTAMRPAPITVFDQGFAGTSGGLVSHLNSDRISMSVEMAELVRERVMYMPFTSNPLNDHAVMSAYVPEGERSSSPAYTRQSLGLPEAAVVLANFNNPYKLDAVGARAWAAALSGAGGGVIWMPEWEGLQSTAQTLRQLFESEGISWDAVVTTPLLPRENHLLGRQLSDAALDTTAFNGHGTAAESLWAAIPVVTLPGDSIGNRVGAAVSLAAGQEALIARSLDDYVLLIQRLLLRPRLARALSRQLKNKRASAPLWDIQRYARHWERSMRMAWEAPQCHVVVAA